tara:strand:+ start:65691 stop:66386 length:696 start_codon:yes stop_codon:yes gene_type:complete
MRAVGAALLALIATGAAADTITAARFSAPTTRYAHGILGDAVEWGALEIDLAGGASRSFTLPLDHVFEDIAPRLVDVTGDGVPEVIVVETDVALGAALAIYNAQGKLAETPHIGQPNRWLAPIGAADLDGDGHIEIAYIDRPHLAKVLRVWRFQSGKLTEVAAASGLTNHRIGESDIAGGIRTCAHRAEMITASADWARMMAVTVTDGALVARDIGPHKGRAGFAAALACE